VRSPISTRARLMHGHTHPLPLSSFPAVVRMLRPTRPFTHTRAQEYIDVRAVEVLNAKPEKGVENALKQVCVHSYFCATALCPFHAPPALSTPPRAPAPLTFRPRLPPPTQGYRDDGGLFLESDCDEQLLINIPFTQAVRLTGLALAGPPGRPGAAPRTLRLFVNAPSLGFAEAEADPSAQDVELDAEGAAHPGVLTTLRAARFKGVTSLAIFISANAGGDDTTCVSCLKLSGSAGETFDVAAIKKAGEEGAGA